MPKPSVTVELETFKRQTASIPAKVKKIYTTPPVLAALEIGEFAMGNAAQGANLQTIYYKPVSTKLVALNVNTSTNAVTASVITS